MREEYVIVLDFLPKGRSSGKNEPIAQVLGCNYFSLLEVIIRREALVKHGDKLYIGEGERKEIDHIKRRLTVNELTNFAKSELPFIIEKMVKDDEERFITFFNKAQPVSTRLHQFELLPGIGKKHMWDLIGERKKGPFKSFADLRGRVKLLPEPVGMISKRIMQEIENDNERFRLFVVRPFNKEF